ncbi:hypothetical protein [Arthrobacter sp. SO5]|uniref:hypothetical protein n=1 Tax=Arthrobacter sp. SO5 TaxID=1897055 RepID=UPI001E2AC977|nr:hypothetical protein [Arthrobacter sp. SO5]
MLFKAEEHFCEVELDSYRAGDFGRDPDGLLVHIKEKPSGDEPGKGHTAKGWKVFFWARRQKSIRSGTSGR